MGGRPDEFAGKRIIVTGAASGIGAAVAEHFTSLGAHVIGLDLVDPPTGLCTESHYLDLSDSEQVAQVAPKLSDPIFALCNVAGVPGSRPPSLVMAVNVLGLRQLTEAIHPRLVDGGAVVNVASGAGAGLLGRDRVPGRSRFGLEPLGRGGDDLLVPPRPLPGLLARAEARSPRIDRRLTGLEEENRRRRLSRGSLRGLSNVRSVCDLQRLLVRPWWAG